MFYTPLSPKAKMFFLGYLLALSNTSGLYTLVEFTGAGGYALSLAIVMIPFVFIIYMLVFFVVKIIKKFRQNAQARVIDTSNHNSF